jgi:hypothetical protein
VIVLSLTQPEFKLNDDNGREGLRSRKYSSQVRALHFMETLSRNGYDFLTARRVVLTASVLSLLSPEIIRYFRLRTCGSVDLWTCRYRWGLPAAVPSCVVLLPLQSCLVGICLQDLGATWEVFIAPQLRWHRQMVVMKCAKTLARIRTANCLYDVIVLLGIINKVTSRAAHLNQCRSGWSKSEKFLICSVRQCFSVGIPPRCFVVDLILPWYWN